LTIQQTTNVPNKDHIHSECQLARHRNYVSFDAHTPGYEFYDLYFMKLYSLQISVAIPFMHSLEGNVQSNK